MSRNIIDIKSGVVVGASTVQRVSEAVNLAHTWDIVVHIKLSALTLSNSISFSLQDSYDNGATWQDVGEQAEVDVEAKTAASDSKITHASESFEITGHGFYTGQTVIFKEGDAAPDGLEDGAIYYIIRTDADNFKLAASYEDALAGTAVEFDDNGTGTQSFYSTILQIRMIKDDASDIAQLPLEDLVRVVCTTGVSDSVTVDKVYLKERW